MQARKGATISEHEPQHAPATADRDTFDLLVIGGGINGAGIARDAAGRGLSVALCEQADLANYTLLGQHQAHPRWPALPRALRIRTGTQILQERERLLTIARLRLWQRLVTTLLLAIPVCGSGAAHFGGDDHRIVADEMLTLPVATLAAPITRHPGLLAVTFLVSRLLDGLKPPPARWLDASHGGVSIVLDDVVSNLWTLALVLGAWHWFRRRAGRGGPAQPAPAAFPLSALVA